MKRVFIGATLAIVLVVVAIACRAEARMLRASADAQRRLATLHYDASDGMDTIANVWTRLPWPLGASERQVEGRRAAVRYWRTQYQSLTDLTTATGAETVTDPTIMLVAANASFRSALSTTADRKAVVGRLDIAVQAYGNVLRRDPNNLDAAYNYEFVSRLRDSLAKARNAAPLPRHTIAPAQAVGDLPGGPTIHGAPGGPPPDTDMSEFKTVAPMRSDEREENLDAGRGREWKRKG